ncbi:MAG: MBL fold metallo-hydrolase [Oscillospiraceae bacterium]
MKLIHINGPYPYQTNTFVIIGSEANAVIIDPAARVQQYLDVLSENGAKLNAIMLTHGHHDHIAAVNELMAITGAKLYMNKRDRGISKLTETDEYIDNEQIKIDDINITPVFTPGHTGGSVCLLCEDMLFAGDTIFAGDVGRTDLEGGSSDEQKLSLAILAKRIPTDTRIFPGHGDFTDMASELKHNMYLKSVL